MSKYNEYQTEFEDESALVAALNDMGYEHVEVHKTAQTLYGYQGDARKEKAHVIVRRKHISRSANDIGYEMMPDGKYRERISDFDDGKHNAMWKKQLKQRYVINKAKQNAKKRGIRCKEDTVTKNGKQYARLQVWR